MRCTTLCAMCCVEGPPRASEWMLARIVNGSAVPSYAGAPRLPASSLSHSLEILSLKRGTPQGPPRTLHRSRLPLPMAMHITHF